MKSTCLETLFYFNFCRVKRIVPSHLKLSRLNHFKFQSAHCLVHPVLIFAITRADPELSTQRLAYLPYWSGIYTRWNTRPCLAALTPVISKCVKFFVACTSSSK